MLVSELIKKLQTILDVTKEDREVRITTQTLINGGEGDNLRDYELLSIGEGPHINNQATIALWFHDPADTDENMQFHFCSDCRAKLDMGDYACTGHDTSK